MGKVLVTGANGFIGRKLTASFRTAGIPFKAAQRNMVNSTDEVVCIEDIGPQTQWRQALEGCDVVIHLAARVHQMNEDRLTARKLYDEVNHQGVRHLAEQAALAKVKRFIFVSTIKVLGESTTTPWSYLSEPNPLCPYAKSKLAAEEALKSIGKATGMEWVIIRPPLIYGAGAKGNIPRLINLLHKSPILPLGGINNQRGMVSADNLCHLITTCMNHPNASGQVFLVQDNDNRSTTQFIRDCAKSLSRRLVLIPVPSVFFKCVAFIVGRRAEYERLFGSLAVDDRFTRERLGWNEPTQYTDALKKALLNKGDR